MTAAPALDSRFLPDAAATEALGAELASRLRSGDVLCLWGGLGAGKTTLARGLISAWLGRAEEAPSPTYTLVQTYEGERGSLWHMDLYRLTDPEQAYELGIEEGLATALCVIEWPERLGPLLPPARLDIRLEPAEGGRRAALSRQGSWAERQDEF